MIRLTSLFLFLGVGMFAPNFCAAEDVQKPFVLAVTVSNFSGEIPVHAHVIDDAGFDIESGDGVKHEFQLKNPDPLKPAKLAYVLEFVMGDRTERFYLSVRDVHFGRTLSFPIDGRPVDTAVRNILINKNCKNVLSGVTSFINEIVVCRKMYLTYDGGSYVDRFSALRGWFDASKALAAMPSSPFRIDPDVIRVVQKFENADPSEGPAAISTYRTFFPADYVKIAMNDLADLWPVAREAKLVRWWVVTEHGATLHVRLIDVQMSGNVALPRGVGNSIRGALTHAAPASVQRASSSRGLLK